MKIFSLTVILSIVIVVSSDAQDFVYTPKNPAFGGSYINYSWLLNSAQVQNSITDPAREDIADEFERDALSDFEESLNRQILNQLSREIMNNQFGEESLTEGSYTIGSYQIDVTEGSGGLDVVILDIVTGNQTTLFVPYY